MDKVKKKIGIAITSIVMSIACLLGLELNIGVKAATDPGATYNANYYSEWIDEFVNLSIKGTNGTLELPVQNEKYTISKIKYNKTGFTGTLNKRFKTLTLKKYGKGYELQFDKTEPAYFEKITKSKYNAIIGSYKDPLKAATGNWASSNGKIKYSFTFNKKEKTCTFTYRGEKYRDTILYYVEKNNIEVHYSHRYLFITVLGDEMWISESDFANKENGYENATKLYKK